MLQLGCQCALLVVLSWQIIVGCAWDIQNYNPKANPKAIINVTNARFTVLTTNVIRMEYDLSNKFEDRASLAVVNRYFSQVPSFTHSITNGNLTISTNDLTLSYKIGQPFNSNSLTITGKVDGFTFEYITTGDPSTDNSISRNLFGTIRSLDEISGATTRMSCLHSSLFFLFCFFIIILFDILCNIINS